MAYLEQEGIHVAVWPGRTPDLNPVENFVAYAPDTRFPSHDRQNPTEMVQILTELLHAEG